VEEGRFVGYKWRNVCQPRSTDGLGVRDIKLLNLCLLAKPRWRHYMIIFALKDRISREIWD